MKKKIQQQRASAVKRYHEGESPQSICASLGKTKPWLYKWVSRHTPDDPAWFEDQSRRPLSSPYRTPAEIEQIVKLVRLNLYNKGDFCGNQAIQWELADMEVQPVPSLSTIGRILQRQELTHRRTGRYTPKGKKYPTLSATTPNQTHQVDMVGPCYLTGPIKFYSLHAVDTAINRCGIEPLLSREAQSILAAVMRSGCVWAFRKTFKWTTRCPFTEVRPIHEEWGRSFASAWLTGSSSGSFHLPSHGGTALSRSSMTITGKSFSTRLSCHQFRSFGRNHWHLSAGTTARIATVSSRGKPRSRHWPPRRRN